MNAPPVTWSNRLKLFWLGIGIPVCLLWGAALVIRLTPPYKHLHDFVQEWTSARNHFIGQPVYLSLNESIPLHFGKSYKVLLDVNAHPPASVLVSLPLGKLDYATAYLAWNLLSLLMLAVSLWLLLRPRGLNYNLWAALPITCFLLVGNSLAQQVNQGQLNLLLLLLLTGCWAAMRSGRSATAGGLLGMATAIKLFPGYLFFYFLARRDWIAIVYGGLAFAFLNGLTGIVLGWDCFRDYALEVVPQVGAFRDFWPNASITGFWSKLLDGSSGHVVPLFHAPWLAKLASGVMCLAMTVGYTGRVWRADTPERRDAAFGLGIVAMLLVSPITWDHYFLLLILPLAICWKEKKQGSDPICRETDLRVPSTKGSRTLFIRRSALLSVIVVLCIINPKWIWDATIPGDGELVFDPGLTASVAQPVHTLTVVSYQFYALLAFFVFHYVRRASDAPATTETTLTSPRQAAVT